MHIESSKKGTEAMARTCLHLVFMTEALTQGGPGQSQA